MKIAITGGTGCLGSPLLENILRKGYPIKLLALPHEDIKWKLNDKIEVIRGDLSSIDGLLLLTKGCEIVFHLAGKVHVVPKSESDKKDFYDVNVNGTKNLIEAAKQNNVNRIVFYSTVGVYGKDSDFYGDEESICNPNSIYAQTKYNAEKLILYSSHNGGPEGVVLRFPVVYGKQDRGNVASLIKAVYKKQFLYFGDGKAERSMVSARKCGRSCSTFRF